MDNNDFSFMKTGFNMLNEIQNEDPEMLIFVTAVVSNLSELALKDAALYVEHSNRKVITNEDISRCIMSRAMTFMNSPDFMNNIQRWQKTIVEDLNNDEEDVDEDLFVNDENVIFVESKCTCDFCQKINNVKNTWKTWEPISPIEKAIKNCLHYLE